MIYLVEDDESIRELVIYTLQTTGLAAKGFPCAKDFWNAMKQELSLIHIYLRGMDISGKELQNRCDEVFITLNKNTVPNEPRSPFVTSGVRIGTPAVTTRGLKEEDMPKIAECIWLAATDFENKADYIRSEVTKLCEKYPLYE